MGRSLAVGKRRRGAEHQHPLLHDTSYLMPLLPGFPHHDGLHPLKPWAEINSLFLKLLPARYSVTVTRTNN